MKKNISIAHKWYNTSYKKLGINAQRRYPNEEFLRFMGRNYFSHPINKRKDIKILEVGCGTCSNLQVIANEGFMTYGIDISNKAIQIGRKVLNEWEDSIDLRTGSMTQLPYKDNKFDAVVDVFSSYCLNGYNLVDAIMF